MDDILQAYHTELLILVVLTIIVITLMILVPQLLRSHMRKTEMQHEENMRALDNGLPIAPVDERARMAGRTALLVPMVVMISCATVTCFIGAYKSDNVFTVSLAVWVVGGVVSLAAITGGVSLVGRLAQLQSEQEDEEAGKNPIIN